MERDMKRPKREKMRSIPRDDIVRIGEGELGCSLKYALCSPVGECCQIGGN